MWEVTTKRTVRELRLEIVLRKDGGSYTIMSPEAMEPLASGTLSEAELKMFHKFIKRIMTVEDVEENK